MGVRILVRPMSALFFNFQVSSPCKNFWFNFGILNLNGTVIRVGTSRKPVRYPNHCLINALIIPLAAHIKADSVHIYNNVLFINGQEINWLFTTYQTLLLLPIRGLGDWYWHVIKITLVLYTKPAHCANFNISCYWINNIALIYKRFHSVLYLHIYRI